MTMKIMTIIMNNVTNIKHV